MLDPQSALSTINEENESEISAFTYTGSDVSDEVQSSSKDMENGSKTPISMRSETFSIDTNASSYKCFKEIIMSSSSMFQNPFYFFPDLVDPGIEAAFEAEAQKPADDTGCQTYKDMCKDMEIYPISKVCKSLTTAELNLKYYVPFEKQMKAICRVLENNTFIRELNLQDNWLSVESCTYLASVLEMNTNLRILKMKECRIGVEGMAALCEALELSSIQELDLSFNSLGNDGLKEGKAAFSGNANLSELNLSHNDFTEEAVNDLHDILIEAYHLVKLDLSWNCFNTPKCMRKLCRGLLENTSLEWFSLAWNGIATQQTVFPFIRFLKKSLTLKYLDMSNNLIGGPSLDLLMKGVAESNSLEHFKIGNNVFSPPKAYSCAEILSKPRDKPLKLIDMENMVVQKRFLSLMQNIREQGRNVIYGAVLTDYEIRGPYLPKVLFGRCKFLGMKPKKKKKRIDFGHFVLSLPDEPMSSEEFQAALAERKLNNLLDSDLIEAVQNHYMVKKTRKIDCSQLVSDYMVLYPDTQPEPPKKKKQPKEKKSKTNKKNTSDASSNKEPAEQEVMRTEIRVLQEAPQSQERSNVAIIERKLSFAQPEKKESKSSKENPISADESGTKMSASKGSLKKKSSIMKKKQHVSYVDLEEKRNEGSTDNVEAKNQQSTSLNASGVFIMESSTLENS
ncbi:uncharacterized protein LOC123306418 isoform X1 [Coccinella septempunctata]|uniref:uncharacterized protein LOC123306418 isoform X1 n=1 Tax=Coccinella septempunctata TaxID=41139 RepID=UPI001D087CBE|nr:uncharacterized protein LOC123306418 isoform X1 [Coccinella septempunctata]